MLALRSPRRPGPPLRQWLGGVKTWVASSEGSLKERAVRGALWLLLADVANRLAGLVKVAVLGRLLLPRHFGLLGIALLIQNWVNALTETGMSSVLIQKKGDIRPYLDVAWTLKLARGLLVAIALFLLAPFGARFFASPEAVPIIRVVAVLTLLWECANPAVVYLRRGLDFRKDVSWRLSGVAPGLLAGVLLALAYRNTWALVGSLVVSRVCEVAASYWVHPYRPRLAWNLSRARELTRAGKWFTCINVVGFLEQQLDSVATGKLLGTSALGSYQMANQIAGLTTAKIGVHARGVLFPAFAKLSPGAPLRQAYLSSLGTLLVIVAPVACFLTVFAQPVVQIVLGPRWLAAGSALAWLAWAGAARAAGGVITSLLLGTGRLKTAVAMQLLRVSLLAALMYLWLPSFGFTGTAMAAATASLVTLLAQLVAAARLVGAGFWQTPRALGHAALASLPFLSIWVLARRAPGAWVYAAMAPAALACLTVVWRVLRVEFRGKFRSLSGAPAAAGSQS